MTIKLLSTDSKGTPCPKCREYSFPITIKLLENYFYNKELICPKCSEILDLWKLLLRSFEWEIPAYLYALVGGNNTWATVTMKPHETFVLNMEELGIPKTAKILQVSYTPQGDGLFPIEFHGNAPVRSFIPNEILLYGKPIGKLVEKTTVLIVIDWVENNLENEIWHNLIEAVESYSTKRYKATIIPSNVAVESLLSPIMSEYFGQFASNKRVSDFLTSAATYSHQLNILLPLITAQVNFPKLPDFIRGNLNQLRGLRNVIAHKGKLNEAEIDQSKIATLICSATFMLSYLILLDEHIKTNKI